MKNTEILELLAKNKTPFNQIKSFSNLPGIYAMFYHGDIFPDENLYIKTGDLVYIGKTETSQESRDKDTHFKAGKTGSSTLRRTIGALLQAELELVSIPRNKSDFQKGRITFFTFNEPSEGKLSSWMKANLSLSFYEYPKPPGAIDFLETELIKIAKPVFNISKNPNNPFASYLKEMRKACGKLAHEKSPVQPITDKPSEAVRMTINVTPENSSLKNTSRGLFSSGTSRSNPENEYKLHEAMEMILKEQPGRMATFEYLSREIWKKGLYKQKAGGAAPPSQIRLRARNYPQFEIEAGKVKLIN